MTSGSSAIPFDCIGFDLDGTLVDSSRDLGMAINHALSRAGRAPLAMAAMPALIGGGPRKMLERALQQSGGISAAEFAALYDDMLSYYRAHIAEYSHIYPGCLVALDALAEGGVRLAVITNKREDLARPLLEQLGLAERFALILGGDSLGPGRAKPQPDLLLEAIQQMRAKRFAFVGDTAFDIDAARAATVPVIGVSFGYGQPEDIACADRVIHAYDALIPALSSLAGQHFTADGPD